MKTVKRMRRRRTPSEVLDKMQELYPDLSRQDIIFRIHSNDLIFIEKVAELKQELNQKKLEKEQAEQDELQKQREIADKLLKGESN